MTVLLFFVLSGTIGYVALLAYYLRHWIPVRVTTDSTATPFISVVIAARNESDHIDACLRSVLAQSYPSNCFEIIVVDDHSDDDTLIKTQKYNRVRALQATPGMTGKKAALAAGIDTAHGEIVAMTDADCAVPVHWLDQIAKHLNTPGIQAVTGPVLYGKASSVFDRFQSLDIAGLALVTASGIQSGLHHLANGANLAFRLSAFRQVNGYQQGSDYASGDDVFLVQLIHVSNPGSVAFLRGPESYVLASPAPSIRDFFQQRMRWASKNSRLPEKQVFWIWAGIWLVFMLNTIALITGLMISPIAALVAGGAFASIYIAEYVLLKKVTVYYGQGALLKGYLLSAVMHHAYVLTMGFVAPFRKQFTWKGRSAK